MRVTSSSPKAITLARYVSILSTRHHYCRQLDSKVSWKSLASLRVVQCLIESWSALKFASIMNVLQIMLIWPNLFDGEPLSFVLRVASVKCSTFLVQDSVWLIWLIPFTSRFNFNLKASKSELIYKFCNDYLECGNRPVHMHPDRPGTDLTLLPSAHGDWPWFSALIRDGVHACDATLVADQWLLTASSCFDG